MSVLTPKELTSLIKEKNISTIAAVFADHHGQLMGKRLTGKYFLEQTEISCCDYLLTLDMEQTPLEGFSLSGWHTGFGDFRLKPDFNAVYRLPWEPKTALIFCELADGNGTPIAQAPAQILKRQTSMLKEMGLTALAASELEFYLFSSNYPSVFQKGSKALSPISSYPIDYKILDTGGSKRITGRICEQLELAGIGVESLKGETGKGQFEIGLSYGEAEELAQRHLVYKHAAKSIAAAEEMSVTFMAKYSADQPGSSGHIHMSLWDMVKECNAFTSSSGGESKLFRNFLAGILKLAPEFFLLYAPSVNSYKRYAENSFAPTHLQWGYDNRTASFRIVGEGKSFRIENRIPGADVNPYLAYAAMIGSGIYGIEQDLKPDPPGTGNLYQAEKGGLPRSLREAAERFEASEAAASMFGKETSTHYARLALLEAESYEQVVSEWELKRYFERI